MNPLVADASRVYWVDVSAEVVGVRKSHGKPHARSQRPKESSEFGDGDNAEPANTSAVLQIRSVTCGTLPQAKQAGAELVRAMPHADQCPPIQIVSCRQWRSNIL